MPPFRQLPGVNTFSPYPRTCSPREFRHSEITSEELLRRKFYGTIAGLQADLDEQSAWYNTCGPTKASTCHSAPSKHTRLPGVSIPDVGVGAPATLTAARRQ